MYSENHGGRAKLPIRNTVGNRWLFQCLNSFWSDWTLRRFEWLGRLCPEGIWKSSPTEPCSIGSTTHSSMAEPSPSQCWDWWFGNSWRISLSLWTPKTRISLPNKLSAFGFWFDLPNVWRRFVRDKPSQNHSGTSLRYPPFSPVETTWHGFQFIYKNCLG